jgi:integrase
MEDSKQFVKLPKVARAILVNYRTHKNKTTLFDAIKINLDTQKTIRSRQVRLSTFRGLLRNFFAITDAQMKPIETTAEEKQNYHDILKTGFKKQKENVINKSLIVNIMNTADVLKLMILSGLRIGEILDNPMKFVKGEVYFKLNKKENSKYHKIFVIGDKKLWIKKLRALRKQYKDVSSNVVIDRINVLLKDVIPETFYKTSTHIARAIYARYVKKFIEPEATLPQVIMEYLNHDNVSASVFYNHIVLDNDVDDFLR